MSKLPKGSLGNPIRKIGKGHDGPDGAMCTTKILSGAKAASTNGVRSPGMLIPVSTNHGGAQKPSSSGVKYKGVSTSHC